MLRQQLEMKKQELFQASKSLSNMQMMMKEQESENERKRRELVDRANMFEGEARKYKEEYSRICDILKSKINDTINNTVGQRRWLVGCLFLFKLIIVEWTGFDLRMNMVF